MSTAQLSNDQITKTLGESGPKESTYDLLKETPDEKVIEPVEEELKPEDDLLKEPKKEKEEPTPDDEEQEEVDDEQLDEADINLKRSDVLKKYPNIFKEFPQLETAYYREQKYAEVFPTIDAAKEAAERVETFSKFEEQLLDGSAQGMLQSIQEADKEAFGQLVDNFLPNLAQVDNNAYLHIIGNISKQTIVAMLNEAQRNQNEDAKNALSGAAQVLHQFLFGNSQWVPPTTYGKPQAQDNGESKKLADERAQFVQEKFEATYNDVETRTDNRIKSTIANNIDPKGKMSKYVKSKAIDDCMDLVNSAIETDTRFKAVLDKKWERAFADNFSRNTMEDIQKTILSKAKTILPDTIRKARANALGNLREMQDVDQEEKKGPIRPGRSLGDSRGSETKELKIPKGMTSRDFLLMD